jgi:hypothetical protein
MTAEEWQARADCDVDDDFDPERFQDEDEFLRLGEEDFTEAELAEIAEAMAARSPAGRDEPDPAGVARGLAAQSAAASAKRRGPGQPGSARALAGESSSRALSFGTGLELDIMPACPDLAELADPGDTYAGASDDELIGVLCAWDRLESHMAARKFAAIVELSRRRPRIETPTSGHPAGSLEEDFTADELAHVLAESRRAADGLMTVAERLDGVLPGTKAALLDGVITPAKAQIIATATMPLNRREAKAAEDIVLGRAGRLTPGGLRGAIARAVMEVAPEKAKKWREAAAKNARVERWGEASGNGALAGRELPPAAVLAADQRISWWAHQLKAAGYEGDMDALRARALLDLLTGTDSRPGAPAGQDGASHPVGLIPAGSGLIPAGFTGHVNLTVPVTTALDLADRPGDLSGFGPVDPWLARDLPPGVRLSPTPRDTRSATAAPGQHPAITASTGNAPGARNRTARGRPAAPGTRTGPDLGSHSLALAVTGRPAATAPGSCAPPAPDRT